MKDLVVILLFLCALSSLAMAFKLREEVLPPQLTVEPSGRKTPAADAGSNRGRPGEDDGDEEEEEDLRAPRR